MLDNGAFRCQISTKNRNTSICSDCLIVWSYNIPFFQRNTISCIKFLQPFIASFVKSVFLQFFQIFSQGFSCHCHYIQMETGFDLLHDGWHAACIIEALCRPASCRTYIQKIMCISVQPVKCISCYLNTIFVRNCRNMQKAVGTAGNSSMYKNRIFKAFHRHDITGAHIGHGCKSYRLFSCFSCVCQKIRTGGRHQCASRKRKSQCFCHDLHGGRSSDKGTCTAAWACIAFCPVQLFFIYLASLIFCTVHTQLLKSQHFRSRIHRTSWYYNRRNIHSRQTHQISRKSLVTA